MTKILVAGHSHMVCMAPESRGSDETPTIIPIDHDRVFALKGKWPRELSYWRYLVEASINYTICLVWGGNEHAFLYMFERQKFDFFDNDDCEIDLEANIIPRSMIAASFSPYFENMHRVLSRNNFKSPVVVVGTPPPIGDNNVIQHRIAGEPAFVQLAQEMGVPLKDIRISSPQLRLKLWRAMTASQTEFAIDAGAQVLPVPASLQNEHGFLLPQYWADDVTHANEAYGRAMIAYIKERIL